LHVSAADDNDHFHCHHASPASAKHSKLEDFPLHITDAPCDDNSRRR
jgi:hypothetical protein